MDACVIVKMQIMMKQSLLDVFVLVSVIVSRDVEIRKCEFVKG